MQTIMVKGKSFEVNEDGFLVNDDDWTPEVAGYIAEVEGIEMTEQHWAVVTFLREYYRQYRIAPRIKHLAKEMGTTLGPDKGKAKYLYTLYPCGPAVQACKIAGLPRANGCV